MNAVRLIQQWLHRRRVERTRPHECHNCRWFLTSAQCRRHAPVGENDIGQPQWPRVSHFDWCGDWELNKERTP